MTTQYGVFLILLSGVLLIGPLSVFVFAREKHDQARERKALKACAQWEEARAFERNHAKGNLE